MGNKKPQFPWVLIGCHYVLYSSVDFRLPDQECLNVVRIIQPGIDEVCADFAA